MIKKTVSKRLLAFSTAMLIVLSTILAGTFSDIIQAATATPVSDTSRGVTLNYGWTTSMTASSSSEPYTVTVTGGSSTTVSTRIAYTLSDYEDTYEPGEFVIEIGSNFPINSIGADKSTATTKKYAFSYSLISNTDGYYRYQLTNNDTFDGEIVDGYINVVWTVSYYQIPAIKSLTTGQQRNHEIATSALSNSVYSFYCSAYSDNGLDLSAEDAYAKFGVSESYYVRKINTATKYQPTATISGIDITDGNDFLVDYHFYYTTMNTGYFYPQTAELVLLVPDYADATTTNSDFELITEDMWLYSQVHREGYTAYLKRMSNANSLASLQADFYVIYPEAYEDTTQTVYLYLYEWKKHGGSSTSNNTYWYSSASCSAYLEPIVEEITPTGYPSIDDFTYSLFYQGLLSNDSLTDSSIVTADTFESAKSNGVYQNLRVSTSKVISKHYFSTLYTEDPVDYDNETLNYISLNKDLDDMVFAATGDFTVDVSTAYIADTYYNDMKATDLFDDLPEENVITSHIFNKNEYSTYYQYDGDTLVTKDTDSRMSFGTEVFSGMTESEVGDYYTILSEINSESGSGILALYNYLYKENSDGSIEYTEESGTFMDTLEYFPVYEYYIVESDVDDDDNPLYSIIAATGITDYTGDDKLDDHYANWHSLAYEEWYYISAYVPQHLVLTTDSIFDLDAYDELINSDLYYDINVNADYPFSAGETSSEPCSYDSSYKISDIVNGIQRSKTTAFTDGMDYDVYIDFVESDLYTPGTYTELDEDDYEYTYVTVPGKNVDTYVPSSLYKYTLANEFSQQADCWTLYIKTRGDTEYTEYANNESGYNAGDMITLPEGTISIKFSFNISYDDLYYASVLSQGWIATENYRWDSSYWGTIIENFDYGVYIYPDTLEYAVDGGRSYLYTYFYASSGAWPTTNTGMFLNDNIYDENSSFGGDDSIARQEIRESVSYGAKMYTIYSENALGKTGATATGGVGYEAQTVSSDSLTKETIVTGSTTFAAIDHDIVEDGIIDSTSDFVYKINEFTEYFLIPKELGFTPDPSDITIDVTGNMVLDFSRLAVSSPETYVLSHSHIEVSNGADYGSAFSGYVIVEINMDFTDDPLINSYATGSSNITFDYTLTGDTDAVSEIAACRILKVTDIDGERDDAKYKFYRSYADTNDLNGNGDYTDSFLSAYKDVAGQTALSMAGQRTILLEEKSDATYDVYKIGDGKADAGQIYANRLTITAAAYDLGQMVVYDNFYSSELNSDWYGTFDSVSVDYNSSEMCDYKVYYSLLADPGLYGEDDSWTLYDENTITDEQIAKIKSVAVVFDDDFYLESGDSMYVFVNMIAPVSNDDIGLISENEMIMYSAPYSEGLIVAAQSEMVSNLTYTELILSNTTIVIRLRDSDNLSLLEGGEFLVYNASTGELALSDTFTTGLDGLTATFSLPRGKYYVVQTNELTGYKHAQDMYSFTITIALLENDINIVDAYNTKLTNTVTITKTDSETGELLANATFSLVDTTNSDIYYGPITTDANGLATVTVPWGNYYLHEITAPTGYLTNADTIVTVDVNSLDTPVEISVKDERSPGSVTLAVKGKEDNYLIPDAIYELYDSEDNYIGEYTTDSEGKITVTSLGWDSYYFLSVNDPEGYIRNEEPVRFSITKENRIVNVEDLLERQKGTVTIVKTDENDNTKLLEGAIFTLYDVNGNVVAENIETDENGTATVSDLDWGSYYFVEKTAPFGYSLSDHKTIINVSRYTASYEQIISITNSSTSGSIKIVKRIPSSDVNLEKEQPTFIFKITGLNTYSYYALVQFDSNSKLDSDGYYAEYTVMSDLPQGEWTIEEQDVIRYALSDVITSVDSSSDPTNSVTIDDKSVTFSLTANTLNAEIEFTNERLYKEGFASIDTIVNSILGYNDIAGVVAETAEISYSTGQTITMDDVNLYYIRDNGEVDTETIDTTSTSVTVEDFEVEYTEPGTYIYPVSITVNGTTYETVVKIVISEWTYEVLADGTATITGYRGIKEDIEVPSSIDGYVVTQIGDPDAVDSYSVNYRMGSTSTYTQMTGNSYVKKITLPTTLKNISNYAFYTFSGSTGFTNLEEIVIQEGTHIEQIYPYALSLGSYRGSNFISPAVITIEDNVVIDVLDMYAFGSTNNSIGSTNYPSSYNIVWGDNSYAKVYRAYALAGITPTEYTFNEGTESIGYGVCMGWKNCESITLPYSLQYLGSYFYYPQYNKTVATNVYVKSINALYEQSCFYYCNSSYSTTLYMPFYITDAFRNSTTYNGSTYGNASNVVIDESLLDGIDWEYTAPMHSTYAGTSSEVYDSEYVNTIEYVGVSGQTISDNIISVFNNNTSETTISSLSNIIEYHAVGSSDTLTFEGDAIPDSLETISYDDVSGDATLSESSNLKYASPNSGNSSALSTTSYAIVPSNLQVACKLYSLEETASILYAAEDLKYVGSLRGYPSLENVSLFDYTDTSEVTIKIKDGVTSIPAYTFSTNDTNHTYSSTLGGTRYGIEGNSLTIPSSVKYIEREAFKGISFNTINLEEGLLVLEDNALYSDYIYKTSTAGTYTKIHYMDHKLTGVNEVGKIVLPESLEYLGKNVFGSSDNITEIYIGSSVKYIDPEFIDIYEYPALTSITVSDDNPYYTCSDGKTIYDKNTSAVIFSIDKDVTLGALSDEEDYMVIVNETLVKVYNPSSETITVPDGVTTILSGAFKDVEAEKIVLPESLVCIDDYAFYDTVIGEIEITKNVTYIGRYAFSNSEAKKDISWLSSQQQATYSSYYYYSLYGVTGSTKITFADGINLKSIEDLAFANCPIDGELIIPASVETIGEMAFANSRVTDSVVFADNSVLKDIGFGAFIGVGTDGDIALGLTSSVYQNREKNVFTDLPNSIETIGDLAFYCAQIHNYDLGNLSKLTTIGDYAFSEFAIRSQTTNYGGTDTVSIWDLKYVVIPENVESIGLGAFNAGIGYSYTPQYHNGSNEIAAVYIKSDKLQVKTASTFGTRSLSSAHLGISSYNSDYPVSGTYDYSYNFQSAGALNVYGNSDAVEELCNKFGYVYNSYSPTDYTGFTYETLSDGTLEITGVTPDVDISDRTLTVPSTINGIRVSSIADNAFVSPITQNTVQTLIVESGINTIGSDLFYDVKAVADEIRNTQYSSVTGLSDMDEIVFVAAHLSSSGYLRMYTPSLITAQLPDTVVSIGSPFRMCQLLHNLNVPDSIVEFTDVGFYAGTAVTDISIPTTITEIPDYWSIGISSDAVITVPATITSVGNYGLYYCTAVFEDGSQLKSLGNYALLNASNVPYQNVSSMGTQSFGKSLQSETNTIVFSSLTEIPSGSFMNNTCAPNMSFPVAEVVGSSAFYNCTNITSLDFGIDEILKSIEYSAFAGVKCDIVIPNSATDLNLGLATSVANLYLPTTGYTLTLLSMNASGNVYNLEYAEKIGTLTYIPTSMTELTINASEFGQIYTGNNLSSVRFTSPELKLTAVIMLYNCSNITDIYFAAESHPTTSTSTLRLFYYLPSGTTIHVPADSVDDYYDWLSTQYWGSTSATVAEKIDDGVISLVGDYA